MKQSAGHVAALVLMLATPLVASPPGRTGSSTAYLTWTSAQATQIGRDARVTGRIAGGQRLLHTERAFNYKLRATWLTRDVIRASARLAQLADRLTNEQTEALVAEAEAVGGTVVMVEIDPNEGSGVIPLDWVALLGARSSGAGGAGMVKGTPEPKLREVRALSGVFRRDYDYEAFWVVFPLTDQAGHPLFNGNVSEAELVVRIYEKEGRVKWPIPK